MDNKGTRLGKLVCRGAGQRRRDRRAGERFGCGGEAPFLSPERRAGVPKVCGVRRRLCSHADAFWELTLGETDRDLQEGVGWGGGEHTERRVVRNVRRPLCSDSPVRGS